MSLPAQIFSYAYWLNTTDPASGLPVPGLGSHRFHLFHKPARLRAMELTREPPREDGGTWGGRPMRVVIEGYTDDTSPGRVLFDGSLPWDSNYKCRLEFPDVPLLAVSQRCHWRSVVEPHFMEWHPTQYTVPFNIFDGTIWLGDHQTDLLAPEPPAPPVLTKGRVAPASSDGVTASSDGMFVHFRSNFLRIAFSLVRPRISFLAWDGSGTGRVERNFLVESGNGFADAPASGPWRRGIGFELPPMLWTGTVEVDGRRVRYRNLRSLAGFSMDVEFEVRADGFTMRVTQANDADRFFLEAEAWRLVWDGRQVYSLAALARPRRGNHRNGLVESEGGFHCTGQGTLSFRPIASAPVGWQIDTSGFAGRQGFAGLLVGVRPEPFGPVTLLAGKHETAMEFSVTNLEPSFPSPRGEVGSGASQNKPIASAPPPGLPPRGGGKTETHRGLFRAWGSIFAFRPEHAGFSNNSFGVNAENCLYLVADLAPYTRTEKPLPSMMELLRYTLDLALKGGPGYACFLEEAHDTAPSQLITAGRIFQVERDADWVRSTWPLLKRRVRHILDNRNADGFYICHRLSGNSRTYHTSSNAWDTFCFGHADGYSGVLAYRALRNAAALARAVGDDRLAEESDEAGRRLRAAFVPTLLNPATGWLAGWRSRDGELHDYAMPFITAAAAIYGVLDSGQARDVLGRLEKKRLAMGLDDFRFGPAPQFDPVAAKDHFAEGGWTRKEVPHRADGADTFGIFTNGGLTPCSAGFYIRALSQFGFTQTADRMCDQLLESFDGGIFEGCLNGAEAYTVDGMRSGYEGTLAHSYHALLAIAQHKGWIKPLEPEWWPEETSNH